MSRLRLTCGCYVDPRDNRKLATCPTHNGRAEQDRAELLRLRRGNGINKRGAK